VRTLGIWTAVTVLIVFGAVSVMKSTTPATLAAHSPQSVTMQIQELHDQLDVKSLPALEIKDPV
jgi:hypothetical protein